MAKLKQIQIKWSPAPEVDVGQYKVYATIGGAAVDYSAPHSVVHPKDKPLGGDGKYFLDIPADFPTLPLQDDVYSFGACAVDDFGNEGDLLVITGPLDFVAPALLLGGELDIA